MIRAVKYHFDEETKTIRVAVQACNGYTANSVLYFDTNLSPYELANLAQNLNSSIKSCEELILRDMASELNKGEK